MFEIRPLTAADAPAFREIRLEALERHPSAFGAALHEDAAEPLEFFAELIGKGPGFGGFDADGLCGTIGLMLQQRAKARHKASLIMVYVTERARGRGLADLMMEHIIDYATGRFEILQLTVNAANPTARRLYERHGFIPYGTEARSLKVDGVYYDELLMYRPVD